MCLQHFYIYDQNLADIYIEFVENHYFCSVYQPPVYVFKAH